MTKPIVLLDFLVRFILSGVYNNPTILYLWLAKPLKRKKPQRAYSR